MTKTPKRSRSCRLYRWYDADSTLLYVGITTSGPMRIASHFMNSRWVDFAVRIELDEVLPDKKTALARELEAIRDEKPIFNRMGNQGRTAEERAYLKSHGCGDDFIEEVTRRNVIGREDERLDGVAVRTILGMSKVELRSVPDEELPWTQGSSWWRRKYRRGDIEAYRRIQEERRQLLLW